MKLLIWIAILFLGVIGGTFLSLFFDVRLIMLFEVVFYSIGFFAAKKICDNIDGGEYRDMEASPKLKPILEKCKASDVEANKTFTFKDTKYEHELFIRELSTFCKKVNKKKLTVAKEGYENTIRIIDENSHGEIDNAYYELYKAIIEAYTLAINWNGNDDWERYLSEKMQ